MTKDELIKSAVKHALDGKRHFGSEQHREAIQFLADSLIEATTPADRSQCVAAIVAIGNLSALQQKLAKAGVIDREKRGEVSKGLFDDLKEFTAPAGKE